MKPDEDGFLGRWSRRKAAARPGGAAPEAPVEPGPPATRDDAAGKGADAGPAAEAESLTDAELLERLELPDPDQMGSGDDFAAFMRDGVPARLRNRALRKLWLTDPTLANLDDLVDYGQDFTDAAMVVPGMKTLYQVGRGLVQPESEAEAGNAAGNAAEKAAETEREAAAGSDADADADARAPGADASAADPTGKVGAVEPDEAEAALRDVPPADGVAAATGTEPHPGPAPDMARVAPSEPARLRRRMAFRFE